MQYLYNLWLLFRAYSGFVTQFEIRTHFDTQLIDWIHFEGKD